MTPEQRSKWTDAFLLACFVVPFLLAALGIYEFLNTGTTEWLALCFFLVFVM